MLRTAPKQEVVLTGCGLQVYLVDGKFIICGREGEKGRSSEVDAPAQEVIHAFVRKNSSYQQLVNCWQGASSEVALSTGTAAANFGSGLASPPGAAPQPSTSGKRSDSKGQASSAAHVRHNTHTAAA